ncbi:phosphoglucosamine mutase [Candidatus Nucleicultrix amoebiphila]|uniref:Phosphoglucosamine mutase n=1 Tax=Candidatus Nucleicultrix amoebiphila FS5 TaxID=1414854 RepID=A0A1W6N4F0_9PROT|nr:phosphoglucosamine mutase [Candidatus Nucleicultrix amoebiphila FS5]
MMKKLFGTDGVRGTANVPPMTPDVMMHLAVAAGQYFKNGNVHHRSRVIIGKDTRLSGYMIEPALTSGFISVGMDVMLLGPLPTPAISMLVRSLRADLGVMISASHNPYHDNGIKLFGPDGYKLSEQVEHEIEKRVFEGELRNLAAPKDLGRAQRLEDAPGRYIEFVKNTFPKNKNLEGMKIVIDCAHGAAYKVAPTVFWELGAEIITIGDEPNGININKEVGATSPAAMQKAVLEHKANLGISLDGDADRVVMADEKGRLIDGDQLMALVASSMKEQDQLRGNTVVATVMSNLGFERYLEREKLRLVRTPVGDRHVCEYMRTHDCNVGGEQSGHIILSDYARTGDGLVAALQVLSVIVSQGKPTSEAAHIFEPYPQILRNLKVHQGNPLENEKVKFAIQAGEKELGTKGHLLVRKSGTEPLLRLMAQGEDEGQINKILDRIVESLLDENLMDQPLKAVAS